MRARSASRASWIAEGSASTARAPARSDSPGQLHQQRLERVVRRLVLQGVAERLGEARLVHLVRRAADPRQDQLPRQRLAGLPAVEQVAGRRRAGHRRPSERRVGGQHHGRGEAAQRRQHRQARSRPPAAPASAARRTSAGRLLGGRVGVLGARKASGAPSASSRPISSGIGRGCLSDWPGVGAVCWPQRQVQRLRGLVVERLDRHPRRAGLFVPAHEVRQIAPADLRRSRRRTPPLWWPSRPSARSRGPARAGSPPGRAGCDSMRMISAPFS